MPPPNPFYLQMNSLHLPTNLTKQMFIFFKENSWLTTHLIHSVSHSNALECICSCFHCMHESCTPRLVHAFAAQLLDSPTSGRVHLWPHVVTETGLRAPVQFMCMFACVLAHITHTPVGPRAQRRAPAIASSRSPNRSESSRAKPMRRWS